MELWKDIQNFEGLYEISDIGRVKSIRKNIFLKPAPNTWGYPMLVLQKNGKTKNETVHRLVATHFIPNPKDKRCINHKDCNKKNNNVDNLEWVTYRENMYHAQLNGKHNSKLSIEKAIEIRRKHKDGYTYKQLASEYNVTDVNICFIINNKIWK